MLRYFFIIPLLCLVAASARAQESEWAIRDPRLRARSIKAITDYLVFSRGDSTAAQTIVENSGRFELSVEAVESREEGTRRLTALQCGPVRITGAEHVRVALGEPLYSFIVRRRDYEFSLGPVGNERIAEERLWWMPRYEFSMTGIKLRLSHALGVVASVGNEEQHLPWWHYGMARVGLAHPNVTGMLQLPMAFGRGNAGFIGSRRIDGGYGASMSVHAEGISAEVDYASLVKLSTLYEGVLDERDVRYVSMAALVTYSFAEDADPGIVHFTTGIGFQQIKGDTVGPDRRLYDADNPTTVRTNRWSPYFRVFFVSKAENVEALVSYYNVSIFGKLSVRIAGPLWLSASALIVAPIRTPESYESPRSIFITPIIRF